MKKRNRSFSQKALILLRFESICILW